MYALTSGRMNRIAFFMYTAGGGGGGRSGEAAPAAVSRHHSAHAAAAIGERDACRRHGHGGPRGCRAACRPAGSPPGEHLSHHSAGCQGLLRNSACVTRARVMACCIDIVMQFPPAVVARCASLACSVDGDVLSVLWLSPVEESLLLTCVNTYDSSCIKQHVVQAEAAKRQQSLQARLAGSTAWSAEQHQDAGSPAAPERVQLERQQQVRPCLYMPWTLFRQSQRWYHGRILRRG